MGRKSFDQLKKHIAEASEGAPREVQQNPADPVSIGPGWPSVGEDEISPSVVAELGTLEKSQRELIRRLKAFSYPYPEREDVYGTQPKIAPKPKNTFYQTAKSRGLLDLLLNPPLIWEIRQAWFFSGHYEIEKELRKGKLSQHGYDAAFHQKMMVELSEHLARIDEIIDGEKHHPVPDSWIAEYHTSLLNQLLREASAYYPELSRSFTPANQIRPHSLKVDVQVDLFHSIERAFRSRKVSDHTLARQLTAVICSSKDCVRMQKLEPNPALAYRNIRDRRKLRTR